jgi:hypothetical protein
MLEGRDVFAVMPTGIACREVLGYYHWDKLYIVTFT